MPWRRRRVTQVDHTPPVPRRPLLWPWLLLLLLLVGAGIGLAYFLTRDDDESSSANRVPVVIGLDADIAVDRLRAEGYPADVRRAVNAVCSRQGLAPDADWRSRARARKDRRDRRRPPAEHGRRAESGRARRRRRVRAGAGGWVTCQVGGSVRETGEGPRRAPAPTCRGRGPSRRNRGPHRLEGPTDRGRSIGDGPNGSCCNRGAAEGRAPRQHRSRPGAGTCARGIRRRPEPEGWGEGPEGIDGPAQHRRCGCARRRLDSDRADDGRGARSERRRLARHRCDPHACRQPASASLRLPCRPRVQPERC